MKRVAPCVRCSKRCTVNGRSLCQTCHRALTRAETLAEWPRTNHVRAEVVEDYALLHAAGQSDAQIAVRLGYRSVDSFQQMMRRANRAGASA